MPPSCAMRYKRRWPTQNTAAAARVIAVRPVAATSWSWNASIAPLTSGRWPGLSSATCAWTTTCPSTTLELLLMSRRPAWCAICSTRRSIRFGRLSRRSKSGAMPRSGSTSFVAFLAFTWKARSIVGRTTGRSGVGTASVRARTSAPRNSRRAQHSPPGRGHPRPLARTAPCRAAHAPQAQAASLEAVHVQQAQAANRHVARARRQAQAASLEAVPVQQARGASRRVALGPQAQAVSLEVVHGQRGRAGSRRVVRVVRVPIGAVVLDKAPVSSQSSQRGGG